MSEEKTLGQLWDEREGDRIDVELEDWKGVWTIAMKTPKGALVGWDVKDESVEAFDPDEKAKLHKPVKKVTKYHGHFEYDERLVESPDDVWERKIPGVFVVTETEEIEIDG